MNTYNHPQRRGRPKGRHRKRGRVIIRGVRQQEPDIDRLARAIIEIGRQEIEQEKKSQKE